MPASDLATSTAFGSSACIFWITASSSSGTVAAVAAHGGSAQCRAAPAGLLGRDAHHGSAVGVKGHRGDDRRCRPDAANAFDGGLDLFEGRHGLDPHMSTPPAMKPRAALRSRPRRRRIRGCRVGAKFRRGPISPATSALPPAASTSARARMAAVRFSSGTRPGGCACPTGNRLPPKVLVRGFATRPRDTPAGCCE